MVYTDVDPTTCASDVPNVSASSPGLFLLLDVLFRLMTSMIIIVMMSTNRKTNNKAKRMTTVFGHVWYMVDHSCGTAGEYLRGLCSILALVVVVVLKHRNKSAIKY